MNIGTRIHAPQGCAFFPKRQELYFLSSTMDPPRVLLVRFEVKISAYGQSPGKAFLVQLNRPAFEDACVRGLIEPTPVQPEFPGWIDAHGPPQGYISTHSKAERVIQRRERAVMEAVHVWPEILVARNPNKRLATIARTLRTNAARYRLLVLSFILFGGNRHVLTPLHSNGGRWCRASKSDCQKLGRPNLAKGRNYGCHLPPAELLRIDQAYKKYRGLGIPMTEIYDEAMRKEWKCKGDIRNGRAVELLQPEGKPFPSFNQFHYRLKKSFGLKQLQIDRFGAERYRNRSSGNRGTYTERVSNLTERVEFDAFTATGIPIAIDGTELPALYVVRARDTLSAMFLGIGFALGAEKRSAYHMALFSMALYKPRFCALFGIDIGPEDWPSQGLPSNSIFDRGVGAGIENIGPIRELAPAYSGQGKAGIETSHQKEDHLEGAPSRVLSNKSPFEMAGALIIETIAANRSTNMKRRLSPQMRVECETATPLDVWRHLDKRGRNEGASVAFEYAVRSWMPSRELTCGPNGVKLYGELYNSAEFEATGVLARAKSEVFELRGYAMDICPRQIWIDLKGKLYELQLLLPFVDHDSQRNMCLADLRILAEYDAKRESRMRTVGPAAWVGAADHYEQTFGKPLDESERKVGRAKPRTVRAKAMAKVFESSGRPS